MEKTFRYRTLSRVLRSLNPKQDFSRLLRRRRFLIVAVAALRRGRSRNSTASRALSDSYTL